MLRRRVFLSVTVPVLLTIVAVAVCQDNSTSTAATESSTASATTADSTESSTEASTTAADSTESSTEASTAAADSSESSTEASTPAATTAAPSACPSNDVMTNSIRRAFLTKHNSHRSMLAMGIATKSATAGKCRPAKKMPELVYDCELEKTAYAQAKLCSKMTATTGKPYQENSWKVTRSAVTLEKAANLAVQRWWSEIKKLDKQFCWTRSTYWRSFGVDAFARVVSEQTTKVGCGIYNCTSDKMILAVCHYETKLRDGQLLYTLGTKVNYCKDCPPPSKCAASLPALCTSLVTDAVKL